MKTAVNKIDELTIISLQILHNIQKEEVLVVDVAHHNLIS